MKLAGLAKAKKAGEKECGMLHEIVKTAM